MVKILSPWLTLVASFLETPHMVEMCTFSVDNVITIMSLFYCLPGVVSIRFLV